MSILQEESELQEVVKLVGVDSLSPPDRLTLEIAKMIREDFLQQNAFDELDSYSGYDKQARLLALILSYGDECRAALGRGVADVAKLFGIEARERFGRAKMIPPGEYEQRYADTERDMKYQIGEIIEGGENE
jgi:V/A-type H+-transporting ATPase subunit A